MNRNTKSKNNTYRKNTVKRTITVREDQDNWLKNHLEINFSGFVQTKLDLLIKNVNKKT